MRLRQVNLNDTHIMHNGTPILLPLSDILGFEEATIHEDMLHYSEIFAELAKICEDERKNYELAQIDLERMISLKYVEVKNNQTEGGKPLSDVRVEHIINCDDDITSYKKHVTALKSNYKFIENILKAYSAKKDMLFSYSAIIRKIRITIKNNLNT